jgi:hypothetical protein
MIELEEKIKYLIENVNKKRDFLNNTLENEYQIGKISALNYVLRELNMLLHGSIYEGNSSFINQINMDLL